MRPSPSGLGLQFRSSEWSTIFWPEPSWSVPVSGALRFPNRSEAKPARRRIATTLLKAVARGYRWFNEVISGKAASAAAIAKREGLRKQYVGRFLPLAFLAPTIVAAIAKSVQPAELNIEALTRADLPHNWATQQRQLAPD